MQSLLGKTPLWPAVQLERVHQTFLKMNRSGVIFVAALNGSALGLGAEFSWANDLRVMADGDYFIGQPEILLGIMPGGGGTQRLTRLVGTHRSLVAILEGKPFTPAEALEIGAVDDVVPQDQVLDRAIELAEHFGTRTKGSVGAIKRAVYFGGSMSLTDGLHVERAEFLTTALSKVGQELMLDYMANTEAAGELPLYRPGVYDEVLQAGTTRGAGAAATSGSEKQTMSTRPTKTFTRQDVSFTSGDDTCAAWLYLPDGVDIAAGGHPRPRPGRDAGDAPGRLRRAVRRGRDRCRRVHLPALRRLRRPAPSAALDQAAARGLGRRDRPRQGPRRRRRHAHGGLGQLVRRRPRDHRRLAPPRAGRSGVPVPVHRRPGVGARRSARSARCG